MANGEPLKFDLATGQVRTAAGEQLLVIPLSSLEEIASTGGANAASRVARGLGVAIGRRVVRGLGSTEGVRKASLEALVTSLAFEVAVAGWGSLTLERWGKALVLALDHAPVADLAIVTALLEGALETLAGREVHGVALPTEGGAIRVLVASEKTAAKARAWSLEGVLVGEVIARLHAQSDGAQT
jgi:hypothetical protein